MLAVSWMHRMLRTTVVVHTTDGQSLRGVAVGMHRDCVVLAHAVYVGTDGAQTRVDGEAVIPRERVSWIQNLQATEGAAV